MEFRNSDILTGKLTQITIEYFSMLLLLIRSKPENCRNHMQFLFLSPGCCSLHHLL